MNFSKFLEEQWISSTIHLLGKHGPQKMFMALEYAIEKRAELEHDEKLCFENKIMNLKNIDLYKLETGCNVVKQLIQKKDLNHVERSILLFLYSPFKENGIERLKQILQQQNNYNKSITERQINSYLNKNKTNGISCSKIREKLNSQLCRGCLLNG